MILVQITPNPLVPSEVEGRERSPMLVGHAPFDCARDERGREADRD
jgi:hypothetical protein